MPFYKYSVEPVRLSRKPLPPDKKIDDELEAVANNSMVQVLRQLSHLVTIADTVFLGVSVECRKIHERTTKLKSRLDECEKKANELNAKAVSVPVGDLCSFSVVKDHYKTNYNFDTTTLFVEPTRPKCIRELSAKAAASESQNNGSSSEDRHYSCPLQRFMEHYYWSESLVDEDQKRFRFIVCRPVIGDQKWRDHLDIETRKPAKLRIARSACNESSVGSKLRPNSVGLLDTSSSSAYLSKEESFDTGTTEENCFSDDEEDIFDLPSPEERLFALSMEYPSTVIPVDVSGKGFQRMASLRRSLIHGDFLIKRKKRKHKRNAVGDSSTNKELHTKSIQTEMTDLEDLNNKPSTSKHGQENSSKHKAFSNVRFRGNRHSYVQSERSSLYASVDIIGPREDKKKRYSMDPKALSSVNVDQDDKGKKSGSKKGKRSSFLPISTLSAAMTVAVKLRGGIRGAVSGSSSKKGRKEENGQSSSGNWSANSSIRGSGIESSDTQKIQTTSEVGSSTNASRSSLEKDSVLSDTTTASKQDQKANGYISDVSATPSTSKRHSKQDRKWLRSSNSESSRSGTVTPERNVQQNSHNGDSSSSPNSFSPPLHRGNKYTAAQNNGNGSVTNDDESESVYSVDTDGYYTSMHTDSGLKNLSPKRSMNESGYGRVCRRESTSSVSTIGNISLNSILSRSAFETSSTHSTITYKAPPTPPIRASSVFSEGKSLTLSDKKKTIPNVKPEDYEELPPPPPSPPLSDPDSQERLQQKTKIKTSQYPFMCSVSPETSDDEPKQAIDPLDYVLKDKSHTFVPLGLNMYGDVSMKDKPFAANMPETPPYTPNEELTLSSFATARHSSFSPSRLVETDSKPLPKSPLAQSPSPKSPPPKTPDSMVILKSGHQTAPLIPLKYAQHITVTPMMRHHQPKPPDVVAGANKNPYENSGILKARISPFIIRAQTSSSGSKSPIIESINPVVKPTTPSKSDGRVTPNYDKPSAKVTLDSDGKVIFSSNSLGRRRDNHPMNYLLSSPTKIMERKYATLPTRLNSSSPGSRCSSPSFSHSKVGYSSLPRQILPRGNTTLIPVNNNNNHHTTKLPYSVPSTNQESVLTKQDSQEEDNRSSSSDSISKKSIMSNEDLFALIHSSKKRLNIKTDSERNVSTPSPAFNFTPQLLSKPANSKNELAESGCLSPRSTLLSPTKNLNGRNTPTRSHMASDRLGAVRQTSLRDFKLLLSQTGTKTPSPVTKKTASEMLKAAASPVHFIVSNRTSPRSAPSSPSKELNSVSPMPTRPASAGAAPSIDDFDGHSTVPFKRGSRGRMSLQTRYDNYNCPPILEEDSGGNETRENTYFRPISKQPPTINTSPKSYSNMYRQQFKRFPVRSVAGSQSPVTTTPIKPATSTWV